MTRFQQAQQAQQQGNFVEAARLYQRHLQQQPNDDAARYELGVVFIELGNYQAAVDALRNIVARQPSNVGAQHELGVAYLSLRRYAEAAACFRQVTTLQPEFVGGHRNLALALKALGQTQESQQAYRFLLQREPHNLPLRLHVETMAPLIPMSNAEIDAYRATLLTTLTAYQSQPFFLDLPHLHLTNAAPPFELAYQGRSERAIREAWAQIFAPKFAHYPPPSRRQTGQPHIGIVVTGNHAGVFLKDMAGIVRHLAQQRFRLTIVCQRNDYGYLRHSLSDATLNWLVIPPQLDQAIHLMQQAQFDMLCYWEIGSDASNYFLPFCRLARVQCACWGTPFTSGNATVDYYLTSQRLLTADTQQHHTESLIQFESLLTHFYRPARPDPLPGRAHFDVPESAHLYVCVQSLLKVHPDFDPLLADILRRDPHGIALFGYGDTPQAALLRHRFEQTMPDVASRIRFIPRLSVDDYLSLLAVADVLLDTLHYGGANTSYEALAMGTPIVTLPSQFQRGRYTAALYQQMGVTACIADTPAEYVELALRLGTDKAYRADISRQIEQASPILFADPTILQAMTDFFEQVLFA